MWYTRLDTDEVMENNKKIPVDSVLRGKESSPSRHIELERKRVERSNPFTLKP